MMYKVVYGKAPEYLNDLFKHVITFILYVQDKVKLVISTSQSAILTMEKSAFQYKGCVIWNVLSKNIRNATTFTSFKLSFKKDVKL